MYILSPAPELWLQTASIFMWMLGTQTQVLLHMLSPLSRLLSPTFIYFKQEDSMKKINFRRDDKIIKKFALVDQWGLDYLNPSDMNEVTVQISMVTASFEGREYLRTDNNRDILFILLRVFTVQIQNLFIQNHSENCKQTDRGRGQD